MCGSIHLVPKSVCRLICRGKSKTEEHVVTFISNAVHVHSNDTLCDRSADKFVFALLFFYLKFVIMFVAVNGDCYTGLRTESMRSSEFVKLKLPPQGVSPTMLEGCQVRKCDFHVVLNKTCCHWWSAEDFVLTFVYKLLH